MLSVSPSKTRMFGHFLHGNSLSLSQQCCDHFLPVNSYYRHFAKKSISTACHKSDVNKNKANMLED